MFIAIIVLIIIVLALLAYRYLFSSQEKLSAKQQIQKQKFQLKKMNRILLRETKRLEKNESNLIRAIRTNTNEKEKRVSAQHLIKTRKQLDKNSTLTYSINELIKYLNTCNTHAIVNDALNRATQSLEIVNDNISIVEIQKGLNTYQKELEELSINTQLTQEIFPDLNELSNSDYSQELTDEEVEDFLEEINHPNKQVVMVE
ncbi:Charged multivesicular body protein 2A [Entamoeba marina]